MGPGKGTNHRTSFRPGVAAVRVGDMVNYELDRLFDGFHVTVPLIMGL
jgi:hypothetical protein